MRIDLSKIETVLVKDKDGNVSDRFQPAQVSNIKHAVSGNVLIFTKS